jgi:hypothetical protein
MATSSRNNDSGICHFSAEHLQALAKQCEFSASVKRLAAPLGSRMAACPPQYIPVYAQCFSEGNLRLPLSRFVCSIFEFYNVRLHQLGPLAVARVTCFEMQCRALGVTPVVGLFRHFFSLDCSRDTYSFLPRRKSKKHETPPAFLTALRPASYGEIISSGWEKVSFLYFSPSRPWIHENVPRKTRLPALRNLTLLMRHSWAVTKCIAGPIALLRWHTVA